MHTLWLRSDFSLCRYVFVCRQLGASVKKVVPGPATMPSPTKKGDPGTNASQRDYLEGAVLHLPAQGVQLRLRSVSAGARPRTESRAPQPGGGH